MFGNKHTLLVTFCVVLIEFNFIEADKARYDNYRLYRFHLKTEEQVKLFQQIEEESDSYTFYGHAREPGQKLTVMVAAQKIAEIHDVMKRFDVEGTILVSIVQNTAFRFLRTLNFLGLQRTKEDRY